MFTTCFFKAITFLKDLTDQRYTQKVKGLWLAFQETITPSDITLHTDFATTSIILLVLLVQLIKKVWQELRVYIKYTCRRAISTTGAALLLLKVMF